MYYIYSLSLSLSLYIYIYIYIYIVYANFQVALVVKDWFASTRNIRDTGSVPESGRSPGVGNGSSLQYPYLENPMDRGAWQGIVHRVAKSWT